MSELMIHKPYAYCRELRADMQNPSYFRAYRDAPGTIALQFRTFAPITGNRLGKSRAMIAGASLTVEEAAQLRDALSEFITNN